MRPGACADYDRAAGRLGVVRIRILHRHGASQRPRRKPGLDEASRSTLTKATYPNHVWTVDFKGWVMLNPLQRCDPLAGCDLFSHFVIGCRAQPNQQFGRTLRAFKKLMPIIPRVGLSTKAKRV